MVPDLFLVSPKAVTYQPMHLCKPLKWHAFFSPVVKYIFWSFLKISETFILRKKNLACWPCVGDGQSYMSNMAMGGRWLLVIRSKEMIAGFTVFYCNFLLLCLDKIVSTDLWSWCLLDIYSTSSFPPPPPPVVWCCPTGQVLVFDRLVQLCPTCTPLASTCILMVSMV